MKTPLFSILAMAVLTCVSLRAQQTGPTPFPDIHDQAAWKGSGPLPPVPKSPWMAQNREYFWTQRDAKQGAVVFVGDSLLGNWDLAKVKTAQAFPHLKNVANRAIGGDVSRGVLFRFQEDVLDLHPEAIVMLVGTNDLSAKGQVSDTVSNINAILDLAQAQNPDMPIILCKLPPRRSLIAPVDVSEVLKLNDAIGAIPQSRKNVTVFDTYTLFGDSEGNPDPVNYKKDLMHPSDDGYAKMADGLGKIFEQLNLK
jgi:lysophospholipase L1-like esterase